VISRWLYKFKHAIDGSIEKFKERFVARGSPKEREWTTMRHFIHSLGTLPLEKLCPWFHLWDGGYIIWM
jgi:hypothetical protein